MSLLLTSCTMGKQPGRLLNKGPQYLRTRTNSGLFAQHKKSAVELLAASKAQFYTIKHSVDLDKHQDLAVTKGQNERYSKEFQKKEPLRSKSEFDLSQLHLARTDEESDENNNDISDDSISFAKDIINSSNFDQNNTTVNYSSNFDQNNTTVNYSSNFDQNNTTVNYSSNSEEEEKTSLVVQSSLQKENALNCSRTHISSVGITLKNSLKPQPKLIVLQSATQTTEQIPNKVDSKFQTLKDELDGIVIKKPVPLPRKSKEKPIPPPRKLSIRTPIPEIVKDSNLSPTDIASASCLQNNLSFSSKNPIQETPKLKTEISSAHTQATICRKQSLVDSLTQSFPVLSTRSPPPDLETSQQSPNKVQNSENKTEGENLNIYTATAIFISKPDTGSQTVHARKISTTENGTSICFTPGVNSALETSSVIGVGFENINNKKRCPDVSAVGRVVKREKSVDSYFIHPKPGNIAPVLASRFKTVDKNSSLLTSKLEMSIESVDQAVYESEISAIPTVSVESTIMQEVDQEVREITRSNSSLSGKFEQQSSSPLSVSPTPHCSSVPRSYSDISCRLEGQHSRDSSSVSNHSRLSRASVGTDLENFFNQMGLERGVLEPIARLKELQTSEVFDSMSSLDSHDAASICSTYSPSEPEGSDSQSTDRSQHQTSIIERNARIIKWLCNVRKAKNQPQNSDNAAASNA